MSIAEIPALLPNSPSAAPLVLENGDRLTRAEFERRFDAMPGLKKAELIEGVVHMPSPVHHSKHSAPHLDLGAILGTYRARTPGVSGGDNGSIRLDMDNMPQPDLYLILDSACGGQATVSHDDYVEGAPELIVEVAASSVSYDLHDKMNAYRRNGVREYVVWRVEDRAIDWFVLHEGRYVPMPAAEDGVFRSRVFPGLWLDAAALIRGDLVRVHGVLAEGLETEEHAAFIQRSAGAAGSGA